MFGSGNRSNNFGDDSVFGRGNPVENRHGNSRWDFSSNSNVPNKLPSFKNAFGERARSGFYNTHVKNNIWYGNGLDEKRERDKREAQRNAEVRERYSSYEREKIRAQREYDERRARERDQEKREKEKRERQERLEREERRIRYDRELQERRRRNQEEKNWASINNAWKSNH